VHISPVGRRDELGVGRIAGEIEAIPPRITPSSESSSMGYLGSCVRDEYANPD